MKSFFINKTHQKINAIKKCYFIFLFFLCISSSFAQNKYSLISTINIEADFFTSDNQSNIYAIKGDELIKFDKNGKLLYKYSNKNLGNIDFVDASNMLRLLVFYRKFSQIIFLDNTLSINGEPLALDKINYQQTQLVCSSFNNGIWLYNQQNMEILRMNQSNEITQESGNLSNLINIDLLPNYFMEYNNRIYLNNPSSGILIFDIYGTYYKTFFEKNIKHFQAIGDMIYYISDKKVLSYNLKTTETLQFETPEIEFQNFRLEMDVLILQGSKSISIYRIQ